MRSRYSAFATGNADYLLDSWHPDTGPETLTLDDEVSWFRLDIIQTISGSPFDTEGIVEFAAYYRQETPEGRIKGSQQERSFFRKEQGKWLYVGQA